MRLYLIIFYFSLTWFFLALNFFYISLHFIHSLLRLETLLAFINMTYPGLCRSPTWSRRGWTICWRTCPPRTWRSRPCACCPCFVDRGFLSPQSWKSANEWNNSRKKDTTRAKPASLEKIRGWRLISKSWLKKRNMSENCGC